jgi:hypothetical protein
MHSGLRVYFISALFTISSETDDTGAACALNADHRSSTDM